MTQEDERIARKLLDLSSRSDRVQIRNGMTYLDGYALGNGTVELRSQVVRDRRMRMRAEEQSGLQFEFAIIYYKDAGDSKTVWLRDGDAEPVQIATWPKRVPLFGIELYNLTNAEFEAPSLIQGYLNTRHGEQNSLDDSRNTSIGSISYKNTVEIFAEFLTGGSQLNAQIGSRSFTVAWQEIYNFSGFQALDTASSNGVNAVSFSQSLFFTPGGYLPSYAYNVGMLSISNNYGVYGLTKIPGKTLFSLADMPTISGSPITNSQLIHGRITYGTASSIQESTWPEPPTYDPAFSQHFGSSYTGGGVKTGVNNGGSFFSTTSWNDLDLIGQETGTVAVVMDESISVSIPGIEPGAERIIALVAMPL
jgi:hypothetical protein